MPEPGPIAGGHPSKGTEPAAAPEPRALRASHEDRDRAVDVLRIAAGDGRLTADELDERLEAALTARTVDELSRLTADLPDTAAPGPTAQVKDVIRIEQRGSTVRRAGLWAVPRRIELRTSLTHVALDFTDATPAQDTLTIDMDVEHGSLDLVVRPGTVIDTDSLAVNYGSVKLRETAAPGTPITFRVELTGSLHFGTVSARLPRRRFWQRQRHRPAPPSLPAG